ncbi:MAG: polysaccharide deacetylase family protein [Rhizomicrobium sp.]
MTADTPPRAAWPPAQDGPVLIVVIDTEEEFNWSAPFDRSATTVANIEFQPLAQAVMDRHGVVPTYAIDYPVADTATAVSVLRPIAERGGCEIGAHLHPWVNPPHEGTVDDFHSFPGNLAPELEREKLAILQRRIQRAFGVRPIIYKAGRYGIGPSTFETLVELGFRIDVSVVPHTDFSAGHGPDFTRFPSSPFRPRNELVALPLSVHFAGALSAAGPALYPLVSSRAGQRLRAGAMLSRLGLLERLRLSPEGHTLADMKRQTRVALAHGERYFMLTWHSSSLLPGTNPYVRTEEDRQRFLSTQDAYFAFFAGACGGRTTSVSAFASSLARDGFTSRGQTTPQD